MVAVGVVVGAREAGCVVRKRNGWGERDRAEMS